MLVALTAAPKPSPAIEYCVAAPIVATSNVQSATPPPPTRLSAIVIVSFSACPVPALVTVTAYTPFDSTCNVNSCPVPLPVLVPTRPL